jgi:hypothetical protein
MPKQSDYDSRLLARLIREQGQVITRSQALECRLPHATIDNKVAADGPWQALLPGVYLTVTGTPTQDHREIAALLYAGPAGMLTGPCAVRRHRLRSPGPATVDVLVSRAVRRQSLSFVRLHRTERMPKTWFATGPVRFAEVPRAVADAARQLDSLSDVRSVIFEALQQRACTVDQLITELREGPARGSSLIRTVMTEAIDGVRSGAEADFRMLLMRGRVPRPMFNARLYTADGDFIAMVDAWWDDAGVAAEVDSRAYHISPAAQDRDRDRHDMLIAHGVFPLHFSPRRIRAEGEGVLRDIEAAIAKGSQRPRLSIVAVPVDEGTTFARART